MAFTNPHKKNYQRKTGYYWVVWSMEPDGVTEYKRIGYYNERFGQWFFAGDTRAYLDADLLGIHELPVADLPGVRWWHRVIFFTALVLVICYGLYLLKLLITHLFK
jgi:hypothetical protein